MPLTRRTFLGASAAGLVSLTGCGRSAAGGESEQLDAALDRIAVDMLRELPELATSLAVSEVQAGGRYIDRLNDASEEGRQRFSAVLREGVRTLDAVGPEGLTSQEAVSRDVVLTGLRNHLRTLEFAHGGGATSPYAVTQLTGAYTRIPDFLDARHPLTTRAEAEAYLARLDGYAHVLDQETVVLREDAAAGILPPIFSVDGALEQLRQFTQLEPRQTVLVESLGRRASEIDGVSTAELEDLVRRAEALVRNDVLPAYGRQIDALLELRPRAVPDAGCWRLPRGEEMYAVALRSQTTTSLTPDEIHEMGLELVRELTSEMETLFRAQGMTRGGIAERYAALASRPNQLYPNTDAGREELLADLNRQAAEVTERMPEYFGTLARAELEIRRVPPYIEAGAPGGYYQAAALDGSRPGTYYINLRDTAEWPRFMLPTLTYHEGIPGHHWQVSIQQEAHSLPFIRNALLYFGAYNEGWALYAEQLADEMGLYRDDPFGRLGYLQSMAFRASRLVVDTGIHHRRWSREQAIQSMLQATGDQPSTITTEVERYAVWPGQACSYMVGRQAINDLRREARAQLGTRFDIRSFHDSVLANGSTPLSVTADIVRAWARAQGA